MDQEEGVVADLDGGAEGDNLVGVDGHIGLLAGEALDQLLHRGDAR